MSKAIPKVYGADPRIIYYEHLFMILQKLGWKFPPSNKSIIPKIHNAIDYISSNQVDIDFLFKNLFRDINEDNLINTLNPLITHYLHCEIDGHAGSAKLLLLKPK